MSRGEKMTVHLRLFSVEGKGEFPLDMLRYDSAWPASEADANRAQEPSYGSVEPRRVELRTISAHAPTVLRWESFGWRVLAGVRETAI